MLDSSSAEWDRLVTEASATSAAMMELCRKELTDWVERAGPVAAPGDYDAMWNDNSKVQSAFGRVGGQLATLRDLAALRDAD